MSDLLTRPEFSTLLTYLQPSPPIYEITTYWLAVFDHWQTLIAGILALAAGIITVLGTMHAANKTIKAANETADREISTAQDQIRIAQQQITTSLDMEQKRILIESFGVFAMFVATMDAVLDDVIKARQAAINLNATGNSPQAYSARKQIKKVGFPELRGAFTRRGGPLIGPFLLLDKEIDDFASQCQQNPSAGAPINVGIHGGLLNQLNEIEAGATNLRTEAQRELDRVGASLLRQHNSAS